MSEMTVDKNNGCMGCAGDVMNGHPKDLCHKKGKAVFENHKATLSHADPGSRLWSGRCEL
ncbi:hypothetical protein D3C84_1130810 [compost metagenome]